MVISSKDSSKKKDKKKYRKEKAQAAKVERKARVVSAAKSARETRTDFWELAFAVIKRSLNGFPNETDTTKLQILNTACKLYVKSPERAGPVLSHLLAMCACDGSVDIRDRARVYKAMFAVGGNATPLATFGKQILLCAKPAPALPSPAAQTCLHALGSLSHAVEHKAPGFVDLPAHPQVAPPSSVRDLHYASANDAAGKSGKAGKGGGDFYSDSDDSDSDSDGSLDSSEYTDSENESGSGSSDDSGSGSGSDGDSGDSAGSGSDDSGSSSDDDADDVSDDDASSDSE
jgi:AP-3 complex subunit beta|tara:strand:+ start:1 stop:864 length:864 start_codon:yes stop_codon:yes gene_type:complete